MTTLRVKSAQRVMEIFEYFAERKSPATLMEIARGLGYPASSTSALLKSLVDLGYLDHDRADRTFLPTLKTALLGIWVNDLLIGHSTILRLMYDLRDRTNDTAILGTQSGLQVQLIHVVKAPERANSTPISSGCLRPLLRSAMGYVLLSLKSEREVIALARRLNAEEKEPRNRVPLDELLRNIEFYRRHGYAYTEGAATPGGGMVAMLLAAPRHQLPLALGIGAPLDRIRAMKEKHIACLREVIEFHRQYMEREWDADLERQDCSGRSSRQTNLVGI
ncbi:MAG TPA: helix-turn-helix domain-containing protein [Beijerinckiaceae bacterium]|jgi:DNA-binding IclR family transcriptional regulator|nr:helix-turn-helix domain-containing protein [Beijerinckiaceae bacterium]